MHMNLVLRAIQLALIPVIIMKAFKYSWIFILNRETFTNSDCMPFYFSNRQFPTVQNFKILKTPTTLKNFQTFLNNRSSSPIKKIKHWKHLIFLYHRKLSLPLKLFFKFYSKFHSCLLKKPLHLHSNNLYLQ